MASRTRSMNRENGIAFPFTGEKLLGNKIEGIMKPRKPLQDLSCKNSENLGPGKALKTTKCCVAERSKPENAKKNGGRRALGDLTNSTKLLQRDAPTPKNSSLKLSSVVETPNPAEEGCLHNHQECMKAQKHTMDKDYFLEIIGLRKDCSTPVLTTKLPLCGDRKDLIIGFQLQSPTNTRLEFDHCQTPMLTSSRLESPMVHRDEDIINALDFSIEWDSLDFSGFKMKESPSK